MLHISLHCMVVYTRVLNLFDQIPSAPIDTSLTPLLAMKSRALFTLAIL
jgi:hypothetical protein